MKKTIYALSVLSVLLVQSLPAEQWTMTLTNSTRCIPMKEPLKNGRTATGWTNNIRVMAGTYYTNRSGTAYMAVTSGTSTNEPTRDYINSTNDAVTWFKCGTFLVKNGITLCVNSGNEVHYNRNAAATTNCPWTVKKTLLPSESTEWHFIPSGGGTSTISLITE